MVESVRGLVEVVLSEYLRCPEQGSAELIVKPEEIRRVMEVYDAAMRSSETGEAVRL